MPVSAISHCHYNKSGIIIILVKHIKNYAISENIDDTYAEFTVCNAILVRVRCRVRVCGSGLGLGFWN